jgi:glyoxylase-like metal-dependent hydrolase (beta-lactamase superfamily II)
MHYYWEPLAGGIHRCRLPFLDVTVGVVQGSGGILLIDSGTTLLEASRIAEDVAVIAGGAVTHLVLTHHHFDHVLGSAGFPEAVSYGPPAVAAALTAGIGQLRAHALEYGADTDAVDRAVAAVRAPDHEVMTVDLDLGGRTVHVEHPGPGHTDHDLVVVVPAEHAVVFCGDLVEESADPAVDAGSDVRAWPFTLDRVLALGGPDGIYVPGHGAVVDAAFVRRQRDWLRNRS